jgi:hypothetical protein
MTQQTTSEKDALVAALEHEQDTTLRVLRS